MTLQEEILRALGAWQPSPEPVGPLSLGARVREFLHLVSPDAEVVANKRVIVHTLQPVDGSAWIVPLFDVHIGLKTADDALLRKFLDYILRTPGLYTFLGGDLMESATKDSVGKAQLDEVYHVKDQRRLLERWLAPLAEAGKILGAVTGNHEQRVAKYNTDDPLEELCHDLNVPFAGYQAYLRLFVGNQRYDALFFHGASAASSKAGKLNAVMKMRDVAQVDLVCTGHTHERSHAQDVVYRINDRNELERVTRTYVVAGSFVGYFHSYSEMKGLPPSLLGAVAILLDAERQDISVIL